MNVSDFYYDLPEELIAQTPLQQRDSSRLLVLGKGDGVITHRRFSDIGDYLNKGDLLVLNNSKVIPARIFGRREDKPEAQVEFLLLAAREEDLWECLVKPGKKARPGHRFVFGDGLLKAEVTGVAEDGVRLVRFEHARPLFEVLDEIGTMPLPPYIKEKLEDQSRYQTVYAKPEGSAAAPTAGLHFTKELLAALQEKGVEICYVTLHVGLGTFRPVKETTVEEHVMHKEFFSVSEESARMINAAKAEGRRVIAVGTTSCRTLEACAALSGGLPLQAGSAETDIFIYPGYTFRVLDGLITNFHLPESTLLMLVSALAGRENIMNAYRDAVAERYRFFSFGDAMFIQ